LEGINKPLDYTVFPVITGRARAGLSALLYDCWSRAR